MPNEDFLARKYYVVGMQELCIQAPQPNPIHAELPSQLLQLLIHLQRVPAPHYRDGDTALHRLASLCPAAGAAAVDD
jgi:hypothetical protein